MIYAVYRCLYGEDFVQESIKSIENYVDKIFVFWDDTPWADVQECTYNGSLIKFPQKFDNIIEKIKELNNPKIELIYDHQYNNINQFTHFVNDIILPNYERPEIIIFLEPDHVFRDDQIKQAIEEFRESGYYCASTSQVELWKNFSYKLPERKGRLASIFWNLTKFEDKIPDTGRHANVPTMFFLDSYVHNLGFAVSKTAMYWKHMTAIGFCQKIGDSKPNEKWLEDKWLNWDYKTNNENLEISLGCEHLIPYAEFTDLETLPKIVLPKSINCAIHKFDAQSIFFEKTAKFSSVTEYNEKINTIQDGTFCMIIDHLDNLKETGSIKLKDSFLVECITYDDHYLNIICIKKPNEIIDIKLPNKSYPEKIKKISLSFICTENELYLNFLEKAINYYKKILSGFIDFDINLAYFGNSIPDFVKKEQINVIQKDMESFSMAYARNLSLELCPNDIITMIDLDCYFSKENLTQIIENFTSLNHHGVINLKNSHTMGNGLYFGLKEKMIENKYNEQFKLCWAEDTEFLMNFSRIGIIPTVYFIPFEQENHSRKTTLKEMNSWDENIKKLEKIMKEGRQNEIKI